MKVFESFKVINEGKKPDIKKFFIATTNIGGDMGTMKRGEIYIRSKSDEGKDYVFLTLANPGYEYYEDVHIEDFKKWFRQIDPTKDTKEMKLLSKWDYVDYGTEYWVTYISTSGKLSYFEYIERGLSGKSGTFSYSQQFADSPKQAIKEAGHYKVGTLHELVRNKVWGAKEYADSMYIVTVVDPRELGAKKIMDYVKKSNLIKI